MSVSSRVKFIPIYAMCLLVGLMLFQPSLAAAGPITIIDEPASTLGASNVIFWELTGDDLVEVEVYQSTSGEPGETNYTAVFSNQDVPLATSCTFDGLTDGQVYYYRARVYTATTCEWTWSNIVQSRQDATPPVFGEGRPAWIKDNYTRLVVPVSDPAGLDWSSDNSLELKVNGTSFDVPGLIYNNEEMDFYCPVPLEYGLSTIYISIRDLAFPPDELPKFDPAGTGNLGEYTWQIGFDDWVPLLSEPTPVARQNTSSVTVSVRVVDPFPPGCAAVSGTAAVIIKDGTGAQIGTLALASGDIYDGIWEGEIALADGTDIPITFAAMDTAGNTAELAHTVSLRSDTAVMDAEPVSGFTQGTANAVSWTAPSGGGVEEYKIQISNDGFATVLGEDYVDSEVTAYEFTGLTDGVTYSYRVLYTDTNDRSWWSAPSAAAGSTQDASGPSAPGIPQAATPTNDTTPEWTWTGAVDAGVGLADYYIELKQGETVLYGGWLGGTANSWTYGAGLADGSYTCRAKAKDFFGYESGFSDYGTVLIDTAAPAVTDAGPLDTQSSGTVEIWAAASDTAAGVASVIATLGMNTYDMVYDAIDDRWECTVTCPAEGVNVLMIDAADAAGNAAVPHRLDVTVAIPPVITGAGPTAPQNSGTVEVWAVVEDAAPSSDMAGATVFIAPNSYDMSYDPVDERWEYTLTGLSEGINVVTFEAADNRGNPAATYALNIMVDLTPPEAPAMAAEPIYTQGLANTVAWTAVAEAAEYRVERYADEACTELTASSDWISDLDYEFTGLMDSGQYWYRVKARDAAGNESPWSNVVYSTQDDTAPTVTIISPTGSESDPLTINEASTILAQGGGGVVRAEFKIGNGEWQEASVLNGEVVFCFVNPAPGGVYTIAIKVYDAAGNDETIEVTVHVGSERTGFGFGRFRFPDAPTP